MSSDDTERRSEHTLVLSSANNSSRNRSNTDFTVHLQNNNNGSLLASQLVYAQVPNFFDNVREGLNSFNIYESTTNTNTTVTVPPGHYSNNALRDKLLQIFDGLYPATVEHPVENWITMTYEADQRYHLNVDMGGDEDFAGTFDAELLSQPMEDLIFDLGIFPPGYITSIDPGLDGDNYVGMWMTVKQKCRLIGAVTMAQQINPTPSPSQSIVVQCRIFKMSYGNTPGIEPGVLPPSEIDVPTYASIIPHSDEFNMLPTSESDFTYHFGTFTGPPEQLIMEPGYYFIGYRQGFYIQDEGYGHGIDFYVAGMPDVPPVGGVEDIRELGTNNDIIQTRYTDNDPKKQPAHQNLYRFEFSAPLPGYNEGLTSIDVGLGPPPLATELFFSKRTQDMVFIGDLLMSASIGDILNIQNSLNPADFQSWTVTGPSEEVPGDGVVIPATLTASNGLGTTGWPVGYIVILRGGWTPEPTPGVKMTSVSLQPPYEIISNIAPRYLQTVFFVTTMKVPGGTVILSSPTAGSPDDLLTHVLGFANRQSVVTPPHTIGHLQANAVPNTSGPQTVFIRSTCFGESKSMSPNSGEILDTNIIGIVSLSDVPWGTYSHHRPEDASTGLHRYRHTRNLSHIDFQITDITGRVYTLPPNQHTTMAVKLFMDKVF